MQNSPDTADELEAEARRRAVAGIEQPIVSMGKLVRDADGNAITVRRYSDGLLILLLKAHRPEKFRERSSVEMRPRRKKPIELVDARQQISDEL